MTPADAANKALHETLAAMQLLLKCCMMLQQDDPDALKISDEIARCVTLAPPPKNFWVTSNYATLATELLPLSLSPISKPSEPLTPLAVSPPILIKYNLFVLGTKKTPMPAMQQTGKSRKRQAENEDLEEVKLVDMPSSDPWKRNNVQMRPAFVTQVAPSLLIINKHAVLARSNCSEGTDDRGFWDVENRPVEWGQDSAIAMAVEKCDKCNKLDVACLILPDKKITCAINGVGIRERMQAKAKAKAAEDSSNPVRCSKLHVPKSSLQVQHNIVEQDVEWRATSSSVGHLTIALQDHNKDLTAHRPRVNMTVYAPPHHANAHLPAWLAHSKEDPHISAMGQQWTHAWDASVMTNVSHVGTLASALQIDTLDCAVPAADVSTELPSDPSTISND
ncbi:hypothetical protein BDR06DRAFT_969740 [Suillus hirtellus]|nr:hypothetical protein BDR06DRAFT_969740 [Suillus hirtellus]